MKSSNGVVCERGGGGWGTDEKKKLNKRFMTAFHTGWCIKRLGQLRSNHSYNNKHFQTSSWSLVYVDLKQHTDGGFVLFCLAISVLPDLLTVTDANVITFNLYKGL